MRIFLIFFAIFFASCTNKYEFLQADFDKNSQFLANLENKKFLVIAQNFDVSYKFAMFDTLYRPISKKILDKNGIFKDEKFLPPCKKCEKIFYQILKMQKDGKFSFKKDDLEIKKLDLHR